MADEKVEFVPPAEYPVKSPFDYSKLSPAGIDTDKQITKQVKAAEQAQLDYAKALEQRFAQPNWFRVAAGLAKPQLGGFGASMGTAFEELGRQQEAQRTILPSISRMRAEVAAGQAGFEQRMAQKRIWDEVQAGKRPMNVNTLQQLGEFGTDTPIYKAAKDKFDTEQTIAGTKSTIQSTSAREQELMRADPYYIPTDKDLGKDWQAHSMEQINKFKNALLSTGMFSQAQVDTMASVPGQLQSAYDAISKQQTEKRLTDVTTAGPALSNSMTNMTNLSEARHLASSADMGKLLGIGSGQDAISALMGYVMNSDDPNNYNRLQAAVRKLATDDPDLYSKFIVLQKALNTNVAQARSELRNQTDMATGLLQATYPNVAMPQKAIVNLLDLMASQNMNDARIAALRQSDAYRELDPMRFESSPAFQSIKQDLDRQKREIVENKFAGERRPREFYSIDSIFKGASAAPAAAPSRATTKTAPRTSDYEAEARRRGLIQ